MSEPSLALQGAIVTALKASASVSALIAARVYDRVPKPVPPATEPIFPYVTLGDDETLADHAECLEGSVEVTATIDVWSRTIGKVEAKAIAGAVVTALNGQALSLTGYRLVLIEHQSSRHLDDPDGLTSHSVVTFRALIDEV